jgi:hypothetical protein
MSRSHLSRAECWSFNRRIVVDFDRRGIGSFLTLGSFGGTWGSVSV